MAFSRLVHAHRGYEYQDLLVAYRLVDILLGIVGEVRCDEKLFAEDRFDDLTTMYVDGRRERTQFKHTENDDRSLSLDTFTVDNRGLRLDRLIHSMLTDRCDPSNKGMNTIYRVVLRDQLPTDPRLKAVLTILDSDPGPYMSLMRTTRLGFDLASLWRQNSRDADEPRPFAFLFEGNSTFSYSDLEWCCERLVIEVGAPRASLSLTEPDSAEQLLLTRARTDVGAETFPNDNRTAVDVAAAMITAARAARQRLLNPTPSELLRRAQLRSDFGAVSRSHPVDSAFEVSRLPVVRQLAGAVSKRAQDGGYLLVEGPPGHGKSWLCKQLIDSLSNQGWLIAEHYCYLGDADGERLERVLLETVFGSLIERLAEADPRLVQEQRPRFAADEEALVACLRRSRDLDPDRRVALIIDGVDHITRVQSRMGSSFDPSKSMSEALASLDLPIGTVIIVLSQPGAHLDPLIEVGASVICLEGLTGNDLRILASRFGLVPRPNDVSKTKVPPRIDDPDAMTAFLAALVQRSAGNALYATYLCKETLRSIDAHPDPAEVVLQLPPFDGTLKDYYQHLYQSLGAEATWVADVIALLDFPVTRAELREIRPDMAHRVDAALKHLEPVLLERATQGGIRVYHESFARYLRVPFQQEPIALTALLRMITSWLKTKGLFVDSRAFHSLLSLLAEVGEYSQVLDLVDIKFVTTAVARGFPASMINQNLATAVGAAARLGRWPLVVRYVELSRAVDSYQTERFDSTLLSFLDIPAALLGADTMATRLLDDDRLVMPAREGLQMCAALDKLGATPPWQAYMDGYIREAKGDNTSYGEAANSLIDLAWLRGRLRMTVLTTPVESIASVPETMGWHPDNNSLDRDKGGAPNRPVEWSRIAEWVEKRGLCIKDVMRTVLDTHGWNGAMCLISALGHPASAYLAIADEITTQSDLDPDRRSPRQWAGMAVDCGIPRGDLRRILAFGVTPIDLPMPDLESSRKQLLDLTHLVQEQSVQWDTERINDWIDACFLAAARDPIGLATAEGLIAGEGWYRCWLRFVIELSRAEAATTTTRESLALEAITMLTGDLRPFVGEPRSCDLYSMHNIIADTLSHALGLLGDQNWGEGIWILKKVSDSISTTLFGELGGPVPSDLVLKLAIEGASANRRSTVEQLIKEVIAEGSSRRYYSDLAEYRLLAARLALASNDREEATKLWLEACVFLTAYGFHKDITIYEVLDPLPVLIEKAPALARLRIAQAQALCERVPLHTDQKETSHAWPRWWNLLAKADPVAAVNLAASELFCKCNDPNWLHNETLEDVWREWNEYVDPVIAGSLRLTLDAPFDPADQGQLESLSKVKNPAARRLLTWLLARLDERPVSYSYTNNAELIARDDQQVEKLNEIAKAADVPCILTFHNEASSNVGSDRPFDERTESVSPMKKSDEESIIVGFPPGMPGLTRAIRAWRTRPYDTNSAEWMIERFANVIGYRLIELQAAGQLEDARSALRSLADASGLGERTNILRLISEGLERNSATQLAAFAYALTWTRARGHGGWLTFGGETEIDSLHRATTLDAVGTSALVSEEIERIIATSRYGTIGISQAIIYALTVGALSNTVESNIDFAFEAWDEAFNVIASRAPRVDDSDDPDVIYHPLDTNACVPTPSDLEDAFTLAALAGLAHPGREKKRRSFLAVQLILEERPVVLARVLPVALRAISDPTTIVWLLVMLEQSDPRAPVLQACQPVLRVLATNSHLTVRAIARRMITGDQPPLAPPESPDNVLLGEDGNVLWTPEHPSGDNDSDPLWIEGLLASVAGERIERAERILERFSDAVHARAVMMIKSDAVRNRLKRQLDKLGDRVNERWPDAFLAHEQAIEEILQSVAAGGRYALFKTGKVILNPVQWEDALASVLLNDPMVPLMLESLRQPRPLLPPPPKIGDKAWARIQEKEFADSSRRIGVVAEKAYVLHGTLNILPLAGLPIVDNGKYRGWHWLGTYEKRTVKPRDGSHENDLIAKRYRILEIRDVNDPKALNLPPVGVGNLHLWRAVVCPINDGMALISSQPIVGIDSELRMVSDGHMGLGVPDSLLVPTASLIALLRLHPDAPFIYRDDSGVALALTTWRTEYDVSDYYLAWPQTCGCGIIIRPDLIEALAMIAGKERLVFRDFIIGDSRFGGPDA